MKKRFIYIIPIILTLMIIPIICAEENLMITIEDYDIKFNPQVKNYTIYISENIDSLNINVNRDEENVIINGNRDLKPGSIITITINNEGTYIINIKKSNTYEKYFIIIIAVLIIINIIRILSKNSRN